MKVINVGSYVILNATDCTLAYNLLLRVPNGLKPILALYETYVANRGKTILEKLGSTVSKVYECLNYLKRISLI